MNRCVRAVISGKVQGVYFRVFTLEEAESLQLSGWVRNLETGEVETLFYGPEEKVEQLLEWLASGPPQGRVDSVTSQDVPIPASLHGFTIRYE